MLKCHGCGSQFVRTSGAGLYCSATCQKSHETKAIDAFSQLTMKGYTPHPEHRNAFTKDGHTVTIEEVMHVGLA